MAQYNILYVLVEGSDDKRLFERVFEPIVNTRYDHVKVIEYACKPKRYVKKYIKSITSMGQDYLMLADIDSAPCITSKRSQITSDYCPVAASRVILVVREIEAWYAAGLDTQACSRLGVKIPATTDSMTKEDLLRLRPQCFDSTTHFLTEILGHFSLSTAKQRNSSFRYLAEKIGA